MEKSMILFRADELHVPQDPRAELRCSRHLLCPLHRPLRQAPVLRQEAAANIERVIKHSSQL